MMNITITLNDNTLNVLKDLTQALKDANILKDKNSQVGMLQQPVQQPVQQPTQQPTQQPVPAQPIAQPQVMPTVPVAQPTPQAPVQQSIPTQPVQEPQSTVPVPPVQQPVPTQAVTYDIQKLAIAAMQLKDKGRLSEIQELIAKYNIPSIMQLKPEQFESFAQDLIAKGVKF